MACNPSAEAAQHQPQAVNETALSQPPPTGSPTDQSAASNATESKAVNNAVSANAGAAAVVAAVADPVCPACLGVLQTPEGALHAVPAAMLSGLPEAEGNAGSWQTCTSGSCDTFAHCIRSEYVVLLLLLLLYVSVMLYASIYSFRQTRCCLCLSLRYSLPARPKDRMLGFTVAATVPASSVVHALCMQALTIPFLVG